MNRTSCCATGRRFACGRSAPTTETGCSTCTTACRPKAGASGSSRRLQRTTRRCPAAAGRSRPRFRPGRRGGRPHQRRRAAICAIRGRPSAPKWRSRSPMRCRVAASARACWKCWPASPAIIASRRSTPTCSTTTGSMMQVFLDSGFETERRLEGGVFHVVAVARRRRRRTKPRPPSDRRRRRPHR